MSVPFNFSDAARRHFEDAELLLKEKRPHNADQLLGLATECALKAIMIKRGANVTRRGDLAKEGAGRHVENLWSEFHAFAQGRVAARDLGRLGQFQQNPFADWAAEQRYAAGTWQPVEAALEIHRLACTASLETMNRILGELGYFI